MPGIIMPGTFLLGAKYCQEQAPSDDPEEEEAVDRGFNAAQYDTYTLPESGYVYEDCVEVRDTNPAEAICDPDDGDVKIYCKGIGLVQDEYLELICYGFHCDDFDGDDDEDDDDDRRRGIWIHPDRFRIWNF
jgi:hypothetical protein